MPLENDAANISKYERENEPDTILPKFKQSLDNKRVYRIQANDSIQKKSPFASVQKINVSNSFHLSNKAMNRTIHSLMQGELNKVD